MRAKVYFVQLSDQDVADINGGGWGGEVGRAYMDAQGGKVTDQNRRLFQLAAEGDFTTAEDAWVALQNMEEPWTERTSRVVCRTSFPRSMSMGDVVVWEDGRAEYVATFGFKPSKFKPEEV